MLIYAFSDIHGETKYIERAKKKIERSDLIICAGDISVFEQSLRKILHEIDKFGKPVLMIHGNHESIELLRRECERTRHIKFLHKGFFEMENILFAGYGGGGFELRDSAFEKFSKKIIERKLGKKFVLVTHGPPYGTSADKIERRHVGNKSYRDFIHDEKPMLAICGHIHEAEGSEDRIGKTIVINAGKQGKLIEI